MKIFYAILVGLLFFTGFAEADLLVSRNLPTQVRAGENFTVTMSIQSTGDNPPLVALTEIYPFVWTVSDITGGGIDRGFIDGNSTIEWALSDIANTPGTYYIRYTVHVPKSALGGAYAFSGWYGINGSTQTGGNSTVMVEDVRPVNVSRSIPQSVINKNSTIIITLNMTVDEGNKPAAVNLSETLPFGFQFVNASDSGMGDGKHINWSFSSSQEPVQDRIITYVLRTPNSNRTYEFDGLVTNEWGIQGVSGDKNIEVVEGCVLRGDYPPCESVSLSEVVAFIIRWSTGLESLPDVVSLIAKWAD